MKIHAIVSMALILSVPFLSFGLNELRSDALDPQGVNSGGGGDRCERRFKEIAIDIVKWINDGGGNKLNLKNPRNERQILPEEYKSNMLGSIGKARITCVSPGDPGHPVLVNGKSKECRSFVDNNITRIVCDRQKFYSSLAEPENDPTQYKMVHHEYATLSGFEVPDGDDSEYFLSNQITDYLEDQVVKKLSVKSKQSAASQDTPLENIAKGDYIRVTKPILLKPNTISKEYWNKRYYGYTASCNLIHLSKDPQSRITLEPGTMLKIESVKHSRETPKPESGLCHSSGLRNCEYYKNESHVFRIESNSYGIDYLDCEKRLLQNPDKMLIEYLINLTSEELDIVFSE